MYATDPVYLKAEKSKKLIINKDYYTNRENYNGEQIRNSYHPKTIVYVIQRYSRKHKIYKYEIIIGKDIDKDHVTGYDIKASGIWNYFAENKERIAKKRPYIYPIFWCMVERFYNDSEKILIKSE